MRTPTRKYHMKDVDMLVTAKTIIQNAIKRQTELQAERTNWQGDFFDQFNTKIDFAFKTYLGIDAAKALRQSTISLVALQKQTLKDIGKVKVQITEDMKKQKDLRGQLLKVLGITAYFKKAKQGDQEALIDLLHQFRLNLTVVVRNQITTATGLAAALLIAIANRSEVFTNANVDQENFKGDKKVVTAEAVTAFNDIYEDAISIAKIATDIFKENKAVKDLFSFNKISKTLNANAKLKRPKKS